MAFTARGRRAGGEPQQHTPPEERASPTAREKRGRSVGDRLTLASGIMSRLSVGPSLSRIGWRRYGIRSFLPRIRAWSLWKKPRWAIVMLLATDALVAVWAALAVAASDPVTCSDATRFAVLAGCGLAYVVCTREPEERRRHADRRGEHVDQTSVFLFPAALLLPVPLILALVLMVRVQRYVIARKAPHTFLFTSAAIAASALGVHAVSVTTPLYSWLTGATTDVLVAAASVAAGVAVYFTTQGLLVGVARGLITRRWALSELLGDRATNQFILSTLMLAVLTGLALAFAVPWVLGVVPIAVGSTRLEQQLNQMTADANHDSKTGLLNDRGFSPAAAEQLSDDQLAGRPSALLFCDVDWFKKWNTELGHVGGDQVLRALADVLRESDLSCRWGGEEFLVLLPGATADEAIKIAERIRLRFATMTLTVTKPAGNEEVTINPDQREGEGFTLSIGIAVSPVHGTDLEAIKEIANRAMQRAKDDGRNRVVLATSPSEQWSSSPIAVTQSRH